MYKLKNVYKTYKNNTSSVNALEDVSIELESGKVVVVLGPSGSGKSTMLNILSGIDSSTSGEVYYKDSRIDKYSIDELTNYRRESVGFIFQSYNLIPNLTVRENVELGAELSENPLDIDQILEEVELSNEKNKYPYQLSGGQMQRVSIARALVKNPETLFCDEPTGALDEKTGKRILKLLQDINKTHNTTMIIVTHNPSIAGMANKVIKMNSGKLASITENEIVKDASELRWA